MFAAISLNPEFFKERLNLAVMIAPAVTVHNCTADLLKDNADSEKLLSILKKMGPEMLPNPQIEGKLSATFQKILGHGKFGIKMLSDSDPKLVSKKGLETFMGHFPAGASFN